MGLERLIMVLENAGILPPDDDNCRVFMLPWGKKAETEAFTLLSVCGHWVYGQR